MPKVLIICQGSAFLVNTLENNLRKEGISTSQCEPDVQSVGKNLAGTDLVLMFAGDYIADSAEFISDTASKCADEFIQFCVIGYPNELAEIERIIDLTLISAEFPRPFDMKDLASDIRALTLGESASDSKSDAEKHRILLCDDDAEYLKTMQEWLSDKYRLTIVKSGAMVVQIALSFRPELILLDYDMPVVSVAQLIQMIRAEKSISDTPIVIVTRRSDRESVMNVMYLKPQGYMLKRQPRETVVSSIDRFFETKRWSGVK